MCDLSQNTFEDLSHVLIDCLFALSYWQYLIQYTTAPSTPSFVFDLLNYIVINGSINNNQALIAIVAGLRWTI